MKPSKPSPRGTLALTGVVLALTMFGGLVPQVGAADWPPAPPLESAVDNQAGRMPPSVTAELLTPGQWRCTFHFKPDRPIDQVVLAGTFNNWNRGANPLSDLDGDGVWTAAIDLPAGEHLYKFVINNDDWRQDPGNEEGVYDGHDGLNSVLRLGRVANIHKSTAQQGDSAIMALALEHDPQRPIYFQTAGTNQALFRLRTLAHDVERIWLVLSTGIQAELARVREDPRFDLWEVLVPLPTKPDLHYTFLLQDGTLKGHDPRIYGVPVTKEAFHTPDWAKHAIWYQIFPERFRNGSTANDPENTIPWTMDWFAQAPWEGTDGQSFYKHFVFWRHYGGDIQGIQEKLPYLKELGVNAIYLNPVFIGWSNHKYDATNYMHIDPQFGVKDDYEQIAATEDLLDPSTWKWTESDKVFLNFLKKAHELGFRVIIDGVFNHVGQPHPAFQDIKKNGPKSPYADWFNVTSWDPFEFTGWAGFDALPEFRKSADGLASESLKQHLFNITRRWMDPDGDGDPSDGIDGWRLDVPNEIPAPFWTEWRQVVKSTNPDAYITGEIWDQADQWLDGKHFDAVMNYEFAKVVCSWVFNHKYKISPSRADQRFRELRLAYPLEATLVVQNLMDSHDTDRVASMAHNPDRGYDAQNRIQDNGPNYDNSKPTPTDYRRARLALVIQITSIGAPMIYYGDEVGMWGADDPTCRKPMLWKDLEPYEKPELNYVMDDQLAFYKLAIALRNAHPALRTGSFQTLLTNDQQDVWAFLRKDANEQLVVMLNASDREQTVDVPLPLAAPNKWHGVFNTDATLDTDEHKLHVTVPAISGVVFHAATPK